MNQKKQYEFDWTYFIKGSMATIALGLSLYFKMLFVNWIGTKLT